MNGHLKASSGSKDDVNQRQRWRKGENGERCLDINGKMKYHGMAALMANNGSSVMKMKAGSGGHGGSIRQREMAAWQRHQYQ